MLCNLDSVLLTVRTEPRHLHVCMCYRWDCEGSAAEAGTMAVRIRLALQGCKNRPFYHIVVAPSRFKRGGRHLEQVRVIMTFALRHCRTKIN